MSEINHNNPAESYLSLEQFQQIFVNNLHQPSAADLAVVLRPDPKITEKFSIYTNNVWHSLSSALIGIMPVSVALVGEDFFRIMAVAYARTSLPEQGSLIGYGDKFADFVSGYEPAKSVPYLADVIALEFARHKAYHSRDQQTLDLSTLSSVPPETLGEVCFNTAESLTLLHSRFDIYQIWQQHQDVQQFEQAEKINIEAVNYLLIFRVDYQIQIKTLSAAAYRVAESIALYGSDLETALAAGLQEDENADPQKILAELLQSGALVGFSVSSQNS